MQIATELETDLAVSNLLLSCSVGCYNLGKHEICEIVDETVRKHVGSPHTGGSSPYGGLHLYDKLTNGLYDNLGKMNLGCTLIAQPHMRLPATGDL